MKTKFSVRWIIEVDLDIIADNEEEANEKAFTELKELDILDQSNNLEFFVMGEEEADDDI